MKRLVLLVAPLTAACLVWPAGSGPGAAQVAARDALAMRERGEAVIVDVRPLEAYVEGHVPGAIRIGVSEIADRAAELRRAGRLPILYCG